MTHTIVTIKIINFISVIIRLLQQPQIQAACRPVRITIMTFLQSAKNSAFIVLVGYKRICFYSFLLTIIIIYVEGSKTDYYYYYYLC